jgi:hypothetical protein
LQTPPSGGVFICVRKTGKMKLGIKTNREQGTLVQIPIQNGWAINNLAWDIGNFSEVLELW